MGLFSNRIGRSKLKSGDHIYSWRRRAAYIYSHHGVYIGNDTVIHFTKGAQRQGGHGVISSSLDSFLDGGKLYRYEYAASSVLVLAKRGGTCTTAITDATDLVIHRANYLLSHGFGRYNLFKNNCENFAIYCKTGLLILDDATVGQSGQIASYVSGAATLGLVAVVGAFAAPVLIAASAPVVLGGLAVAGPVMGGCAVPLFVAGVGTEIIVFSCANRCGSDIGKKRDVLKIPVEDLVKEAKVHFASFKRDVTKSPHVDPMLHVPHDDGPNLYHHMQQMNHMW